MIENLIPKSRFPYLVDIGITSYCPYQCNFCYADSCLTPEYCDINFIENAAKTLFESNVMEVVLGGSGEPTLHPEFLTILKIFNKKEFRLSFTTKNYSFFSQQGYKDIQQDLMGPIAVSCNSLEEFKEFKTHWDAGLKSVDNEFFRNKVVTMQVILGLHDFDQTMSLIKEMKNHFFNNITFLGLKNIGRAKELTKYPIPNSWLNRLKKSYVCVGVDSSLVQEYRDQLIKFGIDTKYLVSKEGLNTCYLNALNHTLYSSSFTQENGILLSNSFDKKEFLTAFEAFL